MVTRDGAVLLPALLGGLAATPLPALDVDGTARDPEDAAAALVGALVATVLLPALDAAVAIRDDEGAEAGLGIQTNKIIQNSTKSF